MKKFTSAVLLFLSSCSYLDNAEVVTSVEGAKVDSDKRVTNGESMHDHYESLTKKKDTTAQVGLSIPLP